jgi:hypothetical protein
MYRTSAINEFILSAFQNTENQDIYKTVIIISVVFIGVEMSFILWEEINYKSLKRKCLGRWLELEKLWDAV